MKRRGRNRREYRNVTARISSWKADPDSNDATYGMLAGERLKGARLAAGIGIDHFFAPAGLTKNTAMQWEDGNIPSQFLPFGERRFKAISKAHRIPTRFGVAWPTR